MDMNSDSELPPATYGSHGTVGQTSHIPGLSQGDSGPDEKGRGRRVGVLETDSPYVKLAKQGGLRDLLWQEEEEIVDSKSNSYRPPTWFSDHKPSLINNEEKRDPGAVQQLHAPFAPFGGDNKSVWERNSDGKEKQDNDPNSQTEKLSTHNSQTEKLSTHSHETSKFRKTSYNKKPVPYNMAKLLSFGYVEEDEPTRTNSNITVMPTEDLKTGV